MRSSSSVVVVHHQSYPLCIIRIISPIELLPYIYALEYVSLIIAHQKRDLHWPWKLLKHFIHIILCLALHIVVVNFNDNIPLRNIFFISRQCVWLDFRDYNIAILIYDTNTTLFISLVFNEFSFQLFKRFALCFRKGFK